MGERMERDWRGLLQEMNGAILADPEIHIYRLPPEVIEKGWIGYDPATEGQIAAAEKRLGVILPPSYREFLKVSNGWRVCNPYMEDVWPVERIDFTRNTEPDLIANWEVSRKDAEKGHVVDIVHTIQISGWTDVAALMLNPQKVTPDGEWEAWFYTDNIPGAEVFPSFWDLMQDQLAGLLDAVESYEPGPLLLPKKDRRQEVIDAIEHVRQSWIAGPEYDPIQSEIDAVYARIRALVGDDEAALKTGLRKIAAELKGTPVNDSTTAQELFRAFANSDVSTKTLDFARRWAYLFVAIAIEDYV